MARQGELGIIRAAYARQILAAALSLWPWIASLE
jgi:hypothetical protein